MKFPAYEDQLSQIRTAFEPIVAKFGLKETHSEVDAYGALFRLQNEMTGLKVEFSPREESGIRATFVQPISGKVPPYPIFVKANRELHYFDLRDIANQRLDRLCEHLRSIIANQSSLNAKDAATIVMKCCDDILNGDFSLFPILEKIVKARAERLAAEFPPKS